MNTKFREGPLTQVTNEMTEIENHAHRAPDIAVIYP